MGCTREEILNLREMFFDSTTPYIISINYFINIIVINIDKNVFFSDIYRQFIYIGSSLQLVI